jgi:FtsZ-binding cell division protein ZapB
VINKFYSLEGKINCLIEILRSVQLNTEHFSEKNLKLFNEIRAES